MDGSDLSIGAVAAVSRVRRPLRLCQRLLTSEHVLLVGDGAEAYAEAEGLEMCDPDVFVTERELQRWQAWRRDQPVSVRAAFEKPALPGDTVGALALDSNGGMASACSTGGTPGKPPGRVGDSPVPGAGFFVDEAVGGCCSTGWGEGVLRVGMARLAVDGLAAGLEPMQAADAAVQTLSRRVDGLAGCILLDRSGGAGVAFNTDRMAYAWRGAGGPRRVSVQDRGGSSFWRYGDPL